MEAAADAPEVDNRGLIRSSGLVALGTGLSRVTGFLALATLAYALGFTRLTDTYNLANTTPNMVYELLLGGVLSATLVPIFVGCIEDDDSAGVGAVVGVGLVVLAALTAVGLIAAPMIIRLLTAAATDSTAREQRRVANDLLRMLMPQMFFYGAIALASALLQARRRFAIPAFAPALANLIEVGVFLAVRRAAHGVPTLQSTTSDQGLRLLLGLGTTAAVASMALPIVGAVRRSGGVVASFDWRHPAVAKVFKLSGWTIGYAVANQASLWVVLALANRHAGGVAAYQGAFIFFQLPHGLLAVSLMTTITPELSRHSARVQWQAWRTRFDGGLRLMLAVIVPAAAGYVVLAFPLIQLLLERGAFTSRSTQLTAHLLVSLAVGLPGFSVYLYSLRGFYSLSDTRTPFVLNGAQNLLTVVGAVALEPRLGVVGLTAAISAAYTVSAVAALAALNRRVRRVVTASTGIATLRIFTASAVMATVAEVVRSTSQKNAALVTTFATVAAGIAVYVFGALALDVPNAREALSVIRNRGLR